MPRKAAPGRAVQKTRYNARRQNNGAAGLQYARTMAIFLGSPALPSGLFETGWSRNMGAS